jgi:hypothetical protein
LTGKSGSSGLYIHPIIHAEREGERQVELGNMNKDDTISVTSINFRIISAPIGQGSDMHTHFNPFQGCTYSITAPRLV